MSNLRSFIVRNKSLMHLNLTNTGLNFEMLKKIMQAIKRSRSLEAVHLCNNPGLHTSEIIPYAAELLNPINLSDWDCLG